MPGWLKHLLEGHIPALLDLLSNLWWLLGLILVGLIWTASRLGWWCDKRQLQDWCNQLDHDDQHVQMEAKRRLVACRSRAILPLVNALRKESVTRRRLAVEVLCEIGVPAIKLLLATRKDADIAPIVDGALEKYLPTVVERRQHEREYASAWKQAWNRQAHSKGIVDRLVALLDDNDPIVQEGAALALGQYPQPTVIRELGRKLYPTECKASEVRKMVAQSLGQVKRAEAIPYLCIGLRDPSRDVRLAVCQALDHINQPEAIPALRDALLPDEDHLVQVEAARALGHTGEPEARYILARAQEVLPDDDDHRELRDVVGRELARLQSSDVGGKI